MWEKSRAAYHKLANQLNAKIIPVGDAFEMVATNKRYAFIKDDSAVVYKLSPPTLPNQTNSIHVGYYWNNKSLAFDANHANDAGKYLGGLVWYTTIFERDPTKIKFKPATVNEEFAKFLRKTALKAVKKN